MSNTSEILYKQVCTITTNMNKYEKMGYKILYDIEDHYLLITYRDSTYITKIVEIDSSTYWHLEPYNNSIFTTKLDNPNSFEIVLFAIKENEELYKNERN